MPFKSSLIAAIHGNDIGDLIQNQLHVVFTHHYPKIGRTEHSSVENQLWLLKHPIFSTTFLALTAFFIAQLLSFPIFVDEKNPYCL